MKVLNSRLIWVISQCSLYVCVCVCRESKNQETNKPHEHDHEWNQSFVWPDIIWQLFLHFVLKIMSLYGDFFNILVSKHIRHRAYTVIHVASLGLPEHSLRFFPLRMAGFPTSHSEKSFWGWQESHARISSSAWWESALWVRARSQYHTDPVAFCLPVFKSCPVLPPTANAQITRKSKYYTYITAIHLFHFPPMSVWMGPPPSAVILSRELFTCLSQ